MSEIQVVGQTDFDKEVKENQLPVLVDFFANWCGHCKTLAPVLAELAAELDGRLKIVKINADDNRELAKEFGVMGLPTLILFKNGLPSGKIIGYLPKDKLAIQINSLL